MLTSISTYDPMSRQLKTMRTSTSKDSGCDRDGSSRRMSEDVAESWGLLLSTHDLLNTELLEERLDRVKKDSTRTFDKTNIQQNQSQKSLIIGEGIHWEGNKLRNEYSNQRGVCEIANKGESRVIDDGENKAVEQGLLLRSRDLLIPRLQLALRRYRQNTNGTHSGIDVAVKVVNRGEKEGVKDDGNEEGGEDQCDIISLPFNVMDPFRLEFEVGLKCRDDQLVNVNMNSDVADNNDDDNGAESGILSDRNDIQRNRLVCRAALAFRDSPPAHLSDPNHHQQKDQSKGLDQHQHDNVDHPQDKECDHNDGAKFTLTLQVYVKALQFLSEPDIHSTPKMQSDEMPSIAAECGGTNSSRIEDEWRVPSLQSESFLRGVKEEVYRTNRR